MVNLKGPEDITDKETIEKEVDVLLGKKFKWKWYYRITVVLFFLASVIFFLLVINKQRCDGRYILTIAMGDIVKDVCVDKFPKEVGDFYIVGKMYKLIWIDKNNMILHEYKDKSRHETENELKILGEELMTAKEEKQ